MANPPRRGGHLIQKQMTRKVTLKGTESSENFAHGVAAIDDFQRPADVALVLLARIDAQCAAERAEQVLHGHRPFGDIRAEFVRCADDPAALDAAAGQRDIKRLREVIATGSQVYTRRPA